VTAESWTIAFEGEESASWPYPFSGRARLYGPCDWCEEEFSQPANGVVADLCAECYFLVEMGWDDTP
jgi:hypothetical protein